MMSGIEICFNERYVEVKTSQSTAPQVIDQMPGVPSPSWTEDRTLQKATMCSHSADLGLVAV